MIASKAKKIILTMHPAHHLGLIIFTRSIEHLLIYHFNEKLNPPAFKSTVYLMMRS